MSKKMNNIVAGELITSGWCPLNCTYCYIPKSEAMQKVHEEIEDDLRTGEFIRRLNRIYGKELTHLGFWGTEPTLTLPLIEEYIPEILLTFPKLEEIGFSTSLMAYPERILHLIRSLLGRKLTLKIQISLDGPAFIVDVNRVKGTAKTVPKHFANLINEINKLPLGDLRVVFSWKATHSIGNIRSFLEDPKRFDEYITYFDKLNRDFKQRNKQKNVTLRESQTPTLVVPGKYTSDDGKAFAEYLKGFAKGKKLTTYTHRLVRLFTWPDEVYKRRVFSCSGGDSNLGIGQSIHICHRTFYYDRDEYIESILSNPDIDNWDVSLFKRGTIDHIRKNYIVKGEPHFTRFKYVMRGYHDFWKFQLNQVKAMMIELALAGQVDPYYLENKGLLHLFALFVNVALSCPMENLLNTGSIHLQLASMLRMFGNGAFQEIVRTAEVK